MYELQFTQRRSSTYSGQVKNSGMSSLTSPRKSCEADSYARFMSLETMSDIMSKSRSHIAAPEQPIREIPVSALYKPMSSRPPVFAVTAYLQSLEHMGERFHPYQEVADDHR